MSDLKISVALPQELEKNQTDILKRIDDIESKLNCLVDLISSKAKQELEEDSYTIKQFAKKLGLSVYKLKSLYLHNQLAIPKPETTNGKLPRYTYKDLEYMRRFLNGRYK